MIEGVDACLHEQVGHGKNCILQGTGNADVQDATGLVPGNVKAAQTKSEILLCPKQQAQNQKGGQILRKDAGDGHSFYIHAAHNHKKQIQRHIDDAGEAQIVQRTLGVARGAQHRVAEIVQCQCRHAEQVDAQIDYRVPNQLILGVHKGQNAVGKSDAQDRDGNACGQTDDDGGMYGLAQIVLASRTDVEGSHRVDAAGQTNQDACEQGDEDAGGAHGSQGDGAGKFAHHRHVRQIKDHL